MARFQIFDFPPFCFASARQPLSVEPPSISKAFPVMCAAPKLEMNNTRPAKSSGLPTLPLGWPDARVSWNFSMPKAVMRLGKTPGQITFTVTCCDMSFDACILERWMQAALEGP